LTAFQVSAQEMVEFHSEGMKQEFIKAGADLNDDGEVTISEASKVEELFFGMISIYELKVQEIEIINSFSETIEPPEFYDCDEEPEDGYGVGHGHEAPESEISFERNFQGLEQFTSLQYLGVRTKKTIENVFLSTSLKAFTLFDEHADELRFPEGSQLKTLIYRNEQNISKIDFSNCDGLKELMLASPYANVELPDLLYLEELVVSMPVDFEGFVFENLSYLELESSDSGIDWNVLPNLDSLRLIGFSQKPIVLTNKNVSKARFGLCSSDIIIEGCSSLKLIKAQGAHLRYVGNNPVLEKVEVLFNFNSLGDTEITNCPMLQELNIGLSKFDKLTIRNNSTLRFLALRRADFEELVLKDLPNLEYISQASEHEIVRFDLNVQNFPKLRYLSLRGVSMPKLEMIDHPNLTKLYFYDTSISSIWMDAGVFDEVRIISAIPATLNLGSAFNPKTLHVEDLATPNWYGQSLERIEKLALVGNVVSEYLDLTYSNSLTHLCLEETNLTKVNLCNASSDLRFSSINWTNENQLINLAVPESNPLLQLCDYNVSVEVYDCGNEMFADTPVVEIVSGIPQTTFIGMLPNQLLQK